MSTHNNVTSAITRVPPELRGKPFTQVVSDHAGPVKFRFVTGGRMYICAPQHGASPALDEALPRLAHREDMIVESAGHHWDVWSVTSDARGVVELPDQAALVAASLRKGSK